MALDNGSIDEIADVLRHSEERVGMLFHNELSFVTNWNNKENN